MRKVLLATVAALSLTVSGAANAAVIGSTPGMAASNPNNVIGAVQGWFDANVYLIAGAPTSIEVWFIGYEASARNTFTAGTVPTIDITAAPYDVPGNNTGMSTLFGGATNAPTLVGSFLQAPGLVNFRFTTSIDNSAIPGGASSVSNGFNRPESIPANFFATFANCAAGLVGCTFDTNVLDGITPGGGNTVLLGLDDGGAGVDDNHDDLVVVLRIGNGSFEVPEPASLAILGAGLLGLGFAARRRRATKA